MMRGFAETRTAGRRRCWRTSASSCKTPCGHCDNDVDGVTGRRRPPPKGPFPVHSKVRHGEWGVGMVMGYEEDRVTVLFDEVGYKTLSVPVVLENELLTTGDRWLLTGGV